MAGNPEADGPCRQARRAPLQPGHGAVCRIFRTRDRGCGPSFGIEPIATVARDDSELERTVADFAAKPAGGLIILPDAFTTGHRDLIVVLAARYRLPAVYPLRVFAASGGLVSDGGDPIDIFRRAEIGRASCRE